MNNLGFLGEAYAIGPAMLMVLLVLAWDTVWKGIGLWRSARLNMVWWFLAILIINSAGILPIIFILYTRKQYARVRQKESA